MPHYIDDFERDANPRSTGLDNAAEMFLDTKYGHVSDDGGVYTRFPATYRGHSTEVPTVEICGPCARRQLPRFHAHKYNKRVPVEMNVTSYGSNSTGLQDAPQRKTQSRVKTACEGSAARRNAHAACESPLEPHASSTVSSTVSSNDILDAVAYTDRKPTSRYSRDYACTVLRVETWKSNQIAIFYSARGSLKCGTLPPPWSSCLVSADDALYYPLWHDNLLHVSDSGTSCERSARIYFDRKE